MIDGLQWRGGESVETRADCYEEMLEITLWWMQSRAPDTYKSLIEDWKLQKIFIRHRDGCLY